MYKFQRLYVYQTALEYADQIYSAAGQLPQTEQFNLHSQLQRAATSIALNIAEGSTGQSDAEQNRFLGLALRSYIETIACLDMVEHRHYFDSEQLDSLRNTGHSLFVKLQAFRRRLTEEPEKRSSVSRPQSSVR